MPKTSVQTSLPPPDRFPVPSSAPAARCVPLWGHCGTVYTDTSPDCRLTCSRHGGALHVLLIAEHLTPHTVLAYIHYHMGAVTG